MKQKTVTTYALTEDEMQEAIAQWVSRQPGTPASISSDQVTICQPDYDNEEDGFSATVACVDRDDH